MVAESGKCIRCRIAVLGEAAIGKTAIVESFCSGGNSFPKVYTPTEGLNLTCHTVNIPDSEYTVEMLFIDCSGMDIYAELVKQALPGGCIPMLVFDVTNRRTFERLPKWAEFASPFIDRSGPQGLLLGNKTDLDNRRIVLDATAAEFAAKSNLRYHDVSAKQPATISSAITPLAEAIVRMAT